VGLPAGDYPYSAPVQKVLIDPQDRRHLLAFGGNQREQKAAVTGAINYGRVYESRDGGDSWATVGSVGANINVLDVVSSSRDLGTIYVATRQLGVLRSTNLGRSWTAVNAGLPRLAVKGLAVDPLAPSRLWAAVDRSASATHGLYQPGGIFATEDGGASWAAANDASHGRARPPPGITTAALRHTSFATGVWVSLDRGASFEQRNNGLAMTRATSVAFDPWIPGRLVIGTNG